MKNNNILFYFPGLYPCITGGMEIYNYHLLNELSRRYPRIHFNLLTVCNKYNNSKINIIKGNSRLFLVRRFGLDALSNILVLFFSKKIKLRFIDIIIIPYTDSFGFNMSVFLLLKYLLNIDYVIYIHDGGLKKWRLSWHYKLFFRKAKKVIGVSNEIVFEYKKRTNRRIDLFHPFIPFSISDKSCDLIKSKFKINQFNKVVLYVGSLKDLKDPLFILKAVNEIDVDILAKEKVGFVFAGTGSLLFNMKSFIEENLLTKYFSFLGNVPNTEIKDLYKIADIFIISSDYEGTPIALMEAMYNNLICIGSDVNGIRELISHKKNGLLFNKSNITNLSLLLEDILTNTNKYKNMGINAGKSLSNLYNYDKYIDSLFHYIIEP